MKYIVNNIKLFIVLGLLAVAFGCDGATNKTTNTNVAPNNARPANSSQMPTNAPVGATPPNMLGSPTASVTVEEFADFQCPTCASVHTIMKNVQAAYGSRIKFIYRNFPLTQIHKNAYDAAVAAEAAGQQGKFWDMQNQIFANQAAWSNSTNVRPVFEGYAQNLGLDVEKFKTDMLSMTTKSRVDADMQRGRALNISSTPTIFINNIAVPFEQMNIDSLKQIIDAELQKAPQATATAPAASSPSANANAKPSAANANTKTSAANADATTAKPAPPVNKQ